MSPTAAIIFFLLTINIKFLHSLNTFTQFALEYSPNVEIHLVSYALEDAEDLTLITESYYTSYHHKNQSVEIASQTSPVSSNVNTNPRLKERMRPELNNFLPLARHDLLTSGQNIRSVKSILKPSTARDVNDALSKISTSEMVRKNLIFPNLVVLWPHPIESEAQATAILNSGPVQEACKGFNIASELIFIFPMVSFKGDTSTSTERYIMFEVYFINNRLIFKRLDEGTVDFHCRNCNGVALRRSNFEGIQLNVSAMRDPEVNDDLIFLDPATRGDMLFSENGFSARMLQILATSLNFSYRAFRASTWGSFIPENNSWVGSVKDVLDGRADIGIAITVMRSNRAEAVSFLPVADEHVVSAFFRNPNLNTVRDIFARPFHPDLWAAVFSTWIVLAFFMILFSQIRKRYNLHLESGEPEPDFTHDSFIWALATACQQGWDAHPSAGSLRTIFISGSFTGVVAYAGYSAAIVSTLSLRVDPIQNSDQLLKSPLKIGLSQQHPGLFESDKYNIISKYQKKLMLTPASEQLLTNAHGYQFVRKQLYAFISTRDNMYDYLKFTTNDSEICALKDLPILQRGFPVGHFVARNSPFKEFTRYVYTTIREPGISWKLRANYTYKRRCLEASDNTGNALGPNDVFTAFMILVGGYCLSLIFLSIEKLLRVGKTFTYVR